MFGRPGRLPPPVKFGAFAKKFATFAPGVLPRLEPRIKTELFACAVAVVAAESTTA